MSHAKRHLFPEKFQSISKFGRILGHEARIQILQSLLLNGETTIGFLMRNIPLSRVSISQHMAILKRSEFVRYREEFPHIYYRVNHSLLQEAVDQMDILRLELSAD